MIQDIKTDLLPSIVVFLVAVPLCIGIALACGVSPVAGLLSGIIGGLVVGSINGCPLMVSGPAAGLIAIVWEIINTHGLDGLALCICLAGCLQMMFGLLKVGVFFRAVSPSVIQGMLSGIGALIFFSQIHVMLDSPPSSSGLTNFFLLPERFWSSLFGPLGSKTQMATLTGCVTIAVIYFWSYVPQLLKKVPAVLMGVLAGSIFAHSMGLEIAFVQPPKSLFALPDLTSHSLWARLDYTGVILSSVGLAFIATAQALLTATATDKLHEGEKTDYNKEVFAQGLGNLVSGLVGALPVTGVIVRSAANTQSGGKTRVSAIMHALWILVFIIIFPTILQLIPVCTLAAALVYTGLRLMNPKVGLELAEHSRIEMVIYLVTAVCIFCMGLLQGVLIGFSIAVLQVLYKLNHCDVEIKETEEKVELHLKGNATFLALPKIARIIEGVQQSKRIQINIARLLHVDHAIIELLANFEHDYKNAGGEVVLNWDELMTRTTPHIGTRNETV